MFSLCATVSDNSSILWLFSCNFPDDFFNIGIHNSESGNILQPDLTYACLLCINGHLRLQHYLSSCSCLGLYPISFFYSCLPSQAFGQPLLLPPYGAQVMAVTQLLFEVLQVFSKLCIHYISCTASTIWLRKLQFYCKQFSYLLIRDNLAQNWNETSILQP